MKLKSIAFATGLALAALSGATHALNLPTGAVYTFEDDNKERVLTPVTDSITGVVSYVEKTSGSLAVGDVLTAIVKFNSINDLAQNVVVGLDGPNYLYGFSQIEITSFTGATGNTAVFKPFAGFEATYGAGAMVALFNGDTGLNIACASIVACEGNAAGGATYGPLWATFGFGDSSDFWVASGTDLTPISTDLAAIAILDAASKVALANYGLSVLTNNTGYTFLDRACPFCSIVKPGSDGLTQIIGSGDVLGGAGLAGPYLARSDFDFTYNAVPEPATLALMGMGLLGMGWTARRRASKQK